MAGVSDPAPVNLDEIALLREAIQARRASGRSVIEAGEQAGLYRVDDGPALTSGQVESFTWERGLMSSDCGKQ